VLYQLSYVGARPKSLASGDLRGTPLIACEQVAVQRTEGERASRKPPVPASPTTKAGDGVETGQHEGVSDNGSLQQSDDARIERGGRALLFHATPDAFSGNVRGVSLR
jgi:hypothetical protein